MGIGYKTFPRWMGIGDIKEKRLGSEEKGRGQEGDSCARREVHNSFCPHLLLPHGHTPGPQSHGHPKSSCRMASPLKPQDTC